MEHTLGCTILQNCSPMITLHTVLSSHTPTEESLRRPFSTLRKGLAFRVVLSTEATANFMSCHFTASLQYSRFYHWQEMRKISPLLKVTVPPSFTTLDHVISCHCSVSEPNSCVVTYDSSSVISFPNNT